MTRKFRMMALSTLLALTISVGNVSAWVGTGSDAYATATVEWDPISIATEYNNGQEFTIPDRTVSVGEGDEQSAEAVLIFPDGSATSKKTVVLDQAGKYTLRYTAIVDDVPYIQEHEFKVSLAVAYITTEEGDDFSGFEYKTGGSAFYTPIQEDRIEGLVVSLVEGASITFNQIIDMNTLSRNNVLFKGFAMPKSPGSFDYEKLVLTFTDVEDPNCYVRAAVSHYYGDSSRTGSYWKVGSNDQPLVGWEKAWSRLHVDNEWGCPQEHSFSLFTKVPPEKMQLDFRWDAETLTAYTGEDMIVDLDNPKYFANLWTGFKSGKCRLSISADMYTNQVATFCITQLSGVDFNITENDNKFDDEEAPVIAVDVKEEYLTNMPKAKVGPKSTYVVPKATAYDLIDKELMVNTAVYYGYNTPNPVAVNFDENGFVTDKKGFYSIEYSAMDKAGNSVSRVLEIEAVTDIEELTLNVPEADRKTAIACGEYIEKIASTTYSGGSGDKELKVVVQHGTTETDITKEKLIVEKAGEYTVIYTIKDFIGQVVTVEYAVTVQPGTEPVAVVEPILPKYFISGYEQTIEPFYFYDYSTGSRVEKQATIKINGTTVNGKYTPEEPGTNLEPVTVEYSYPGAQSKVIEVPVVKSVGSSEDAEMPNFMFNYIVGDRGKISNSSGSALIVLNPNAEKKASLEWANPLVAQDVALTLGIVGSNAFYDQITFTLKDARYPNDLDRQIQADLYVNKDRFDLVVGDSLIGIECSISGSENIKLGYDNGSIVYGNTRLAVKNAISGNLFKGFSTDKVYASFTFHNVETDAKIKLVQIGNQPISNVMLDMVGPNWTALGNYGGSYAKDKNVVIPAFASSDIVAPAVTGTMTVKDPSGNVVTSTDGVRLENVIPSREYTINLAEFGTYNAMLTFNDGTNDTKFTIKINSIDRTKPTFRFNHYFKETAKVGDKVTIPGFTVSDNKSASDKIIITTYVYTPDGQLLVLYDSALTHLYNSNTVQCTVAGTYEFRLFAEDEAGNVAYVRKTFTVQ